METGRAKRAADLSERRPEAAGEIDADDLVAGSGRNAVGERQHARIVDAHQREGALCVGERVRVGDGDLVAGE